MNSEPAGTGSDTRQPYGMMPPALPQVPQGTSYPQPYTPPGYPARPAGNGMAVASLVLGIASIVFCWWGLATLAMVVLAIVLGTKGLRRASMGAGGRNLAIAGLVCGCIGAAFYLAVGVLSLGAGFII